MKGMQTEGQHHGRGWEEKLLRDFERTAKVVEAHLAQHYGADRTSRMIRLAGDEYQRLIPQLPYVGGEQPFTQFVVATGWFLAMYRVLRLEGATVQEAGGLVYLLSKTYLEEVPGFARRLLGRMSFSRRYLKKLRDRAARSHDRVNPDGYVYSFVEGTGAEFDYGVDYHECASLKFLQKQGAPELAPYLCAVDDLYSRMLGWGLTRTTTLAEGGERCDFRFKRGGPTRVRSTVLDLG
jgi:hypothetical protein